MIMCQFLVRLYLIQKIHNVAGYHLARALLEQVPVELEFHKASLVHLLDMADHQTLIQTVYQQLIEVSMTVFLIGR